jgi:hypothetical protein
VQLKDDLRRRLRSVFYRGSRNSAETVTVILAGVLDDTAVVLEWIDVPVDCLQFAQPGIRIVDVGLELHLIVKGNYRLMTTLVPRRVVGVMTNDVTIY